MKNLKILMVCMGNICRSPMAEGVARYLLRGMGRSDVILDSAGTHAHYHHGDAPDPRARRVMRAHGMPIDDLRARTFNLDDFDRFDRILVADRRNYQDVTALARDDAQCNKVGFMLETLPDSPELPDPYLGQPEDFERTFTLLEQALRLRFAHD
ncbi:low molecular weight protein-tyrosine-phosphatase [Cardiobacterium valvarum]|uniref:protein-tyrosine-phosphatase n=1 Tax=Cardiobacterium valvarum F0432 TaxID=797473 RepID=G9ZCM3_9GAMM|nr:low molecular weight protein-tyrosine-phosphatase [Cardiobacterium valvarum]EHM55689.1 low molecular weight phosphotyrosine protein phosphatase [Cardiobacterium valvarum F0432]